ncbi:uncharacterized protein G2W53_003855 [Senna tora]|uniref:Uncharacterized protein n=1 Tax=Senna tora TaxID=362788 RepID=A0A834XBC3_9FABA|nr:uncharacterized protein G2W53_003855 [Senna tora]
MKPAESQSTVAPPFFPPSHQRSVHHRLVEKSPSKKHKDPYTKGGETGDRFDFSFVRRLLHMWLQMDLCASSMDSSRRGDGGRNDDTAVERTAVRRWAMIPPVSMGYGGHPPLILYACENGDVD